MTEEQFKAQVVRLHRAYSEKAYPPERCAQLYEAVKYLTESEVSQIFSILIGDNFVPFGVSKIREVMAPILKKSREQRRAAVESGVVHSTPCPYCEFNGYFTAYRRADGRLFSFSCGCSIGRAERYSFPVWNDFMGTEYSPNFYSATVVLSSTPPPATSPPTAFQVRSQQRVQGMIAEATKRMPVVGEKDEG